MGRTRPRACLERPPFLRLKGMVADRYVADPERLSWRLYNHQNCSPIFGCAELSEQGRGDSVGTDNTRPPTAVGGPLTPQPKTGGTDYTMNRDTGYFRAKYQIGQTVRPEPRADTDCRQEPAGEEFYASDQDDADEAFVRDTFGLEEGTSDGVLCCPGCFTPICYKCRINASGNFESSEAVNVSVESGAADGDSTVSEVAVDDSLSNKRRADDKAPSEGGHVARCDECRHIVAFVDDRGTYHFRRVIASPP
ncbi:e2f-associated phosphoprotein, putative [Babesia ovata]|uniref:E2f-associated phosphoprotein, putative n=1 Tax=Babesia ovata TaxID=189622 RepID=A0A2H6K8L9_9APIC|nr:e2f-associated phosphoprotein, putative [Babesia ovata]GBE59352.1 e2f-associated phosphoprotein, putative [Babesia ovata]